jgi:hypothetical protein
VARPRISAAFAASVLIASAGCGSGHDAGTNAAASSGDLTRPTTITGCIAHGYREDEILLVAIDGAIGSSTTAHTAWHGTRQLKLVAPDGLRQQVHIGQRVTAAGTIVDPPGSGPSRVDQQQAADGMPFREFRATSLQPAEGGCRSSAEFRRDTTDDTTKR